MNSDVIWACIIHLRADLGIFEEGAKHSGAWISEAGSLGAQLAIAISEQIAGIQRTFYVAV